MNTNSFEFKVADGTDKPAIWFTLQGKEILIFPLVLYHSLWGWNSDKFYFSPSILASISIFNDEVICDFKDESCGEYRIEYQKPLFVDSAVKALKNLCNAVINGVQTIYEDDFKEKAAKRMLDGLTGIFHKEKLIESFTFNFVEPYSCDTHFVITIGDRKYESSLSDWTTNFNRIRLDIERFLLTYREDTEIKLFYEDSPTIISLRNFSGETRVTIIPDEFVGGPYLFGKCETRQLVQSLYLGLLGICIRETNRFDSSYVGNWNEFRLATYNKLQSSVIENYIKGIEEDDNSFFPRQRIIRSVEAMKEDYTNLCNTLVL
ncbi:MAG: hypothetical protein IKX18_01350 [Muribaculaceae bacterium]|nr:hypothetical protein [Muribaculaceae bacterium]